MDGRRLGWRIGLALVVLGGLWTTACRAEDDARWRGYRIGDTHLVALYDGATAFTPDLFSGASPDAVKQALADSRRPPTINAFVVERGSEVILIDTGLGVAAGGNMMTALKAAGFKPERITSIFLTHLHPDHVSGLLTGGKRVFPNATVYVDARELAYWNDDASIKTPDARPAFELARAFQTRYPVKSISVGQTLFPQVVVVDEVGHTPGHVGFLIGEDDQRVLVWGDVIHFADMQFDDPNVALSFDADVETAKKTRKQILDWVARNCIIVAGMHLPFPGVIQVEARSETAYRYRMYRPDPSMVTGSSPARPHERPTR